MITCRYGISLLVFNATSHSFATLNHELSSRTLEEKFHIYARPCIIIYISCTTLILSLPLFHVFPIHYHYCCGYNLSFSWLPILLSETKNNFHILIPGVQQLYDARRFSFKMMVILQGEQFNLELTIMACFMFSFKRIGTTE